MFDIHITTSYICIQKVRMLPYLFMSSFYIIIIIDCKISFQLIFMWSFLSLSLSLISRWVILVYEVLIFISVCTPQCVGPMIHWMCYNTVWTPTLWLPDMSNRLLLFFSYSSSMLDSYGLTHSLLGIRGIVLLTVTLYPSPLPYDIPYALYSIRCTLCPISFALCSI